MLALSASDIEAASGQHSPELAQSAIFHRVLAIKSLSRAYLPVCKPLKKETRC